MAWFPLTCWCSVPFSGIPAYADSCQAKQRQWARSCHWSASIGYTARFCQVQLATFFLYRVQTHPTNTGIQVDAPADPRHQEKPRRAYLNAESALKSAVDAYDYKSSFRDGWGILCLRVQALFAFARFLYYGLSKHRKRGGRFLQAEASEGYFQAEPVWFWAWVCPPCPAPRLAAHDNFEEVMGLLYIDVV